MFLGHFGVAYGLKRVEPRLSLGSLFFATQLVDILWGGFLLTGWERARIAPGFTPVTPLEFISYPLTHSLVAGLIWAVLAGGIVYSLPTRDTSHHHRMRALMIAVAVLSHWFLDLLVHVPDLPLSGDDSTKLGLGLWRSLPATLAAELVVFALGFILYALWRRRNGGLTWRAPALAGLLVVIYLANLLGGAPPGITAVAVTDIVGMLALAGLAAWADRAPRPVAAEPARGKKRKARR